MAKKKAARKKSAKKAKTVNPHRSMRVKRRSSARKPRKKKPAQPTTQEPEYGPTFFLTAESETAQAYEIDGTPHYKTVRSYRLEHAAVREFEEQDGKILYKIKPLKSPAG